MSGFRVLSGARAGLVFVPEREEFTVGRHAAADLRFSAESDLEVSARHALFRHLPGGWVVRDLGSRNGTWVNGARISGEVAVQPGDRISFGPQGPVLEVPGGAAAGPATVAARGESVTGQIRAAVGRERRRWRWVAGGLGVVLLAVVAAFLYADQRRSSSWERERQALQSRIDSVLEANRAPVAALQGQVAGLTEALQQSDAELRQLRTRLEQAQHQARGSGDIEALQEQLQAAVTALRRQQRAAALDFATIARHNRPALAKIWVEFEDGTRQTGTGFAVRADGTLITNRHVLLGEDGRQRPRRIAIQFSDSRQFWPGRVLATSTDWDLGLVKARNITGAIPVVQGLNLRPDTLASGAPLALMGFPLGGDVTAGESETTQLARPLMYAGVLDGTGTRGLEIQGYGAAGASGAPVFDGQGEVIGVLFGGRADGAVQTLYAVPAAAVAALLADNR